ncbi:hypothetical protein AC231_13575 [Clostridium pasteurianum]|nr:hypothetical protein AQ983_03920 [Clostridium pasteurianum DSM 525 = ATCC 6013]AOZ78093.1 hypothetical protein AQ984_03925 [Clostridium pasteurianum]OMH21510.1 hypothetical protein AC231_13575 [Clostridium pasteurianum]
MWIFAILKIYAHMCPFLLNYSLKCLYKGISKFSIEVIYSDYLHDGNINYESKSKNESGE